MQTASQRLYLTADRKRLVPEGDRKAATLYAAVGDQIPDNAAEKFGLADGRLKGAKAAHGEGGGSKEKQPGGDKEKAPGGDKSAAAPPPLTSIKGIGAKTADALAAAGIGTPEALAQVDPAKPPFSDGLPPRFDWAKVVEAAKALAPAPDDGGEGEAAEAAAAS